MCGLMWFQELIPIKHMFKDFKLHAQNMITILGSTINIIGGRGGGGGGEERGKRETGGLV
jgi:hypothetical protein